MNDYRPAAQPKTKDLSALVEQLKPQIARALPKHLDADRIARLALTTLRQTPALNRTTPESFLGALMTASALGLEPGPLGDVYFVPFGNQCQFVPGYRGLIKLARRSGELVDIWAEVAYENDEFAWTLGLHRDLTHVPAKGERGKPTHVYAAAELKDGGRPFVVMTVADVEAIRARSKAGKSGPWVTDWEAMAKKTAVKQLSKWLPLSTEFAAALTHDGAVRTDTAATLDDVAPTFIDSELVVEEPAAGALTQGELPTPDSDVLVEVDA